MGYPPSPHNNINIHVGGVYSSLGRSKEETLRCWAASFERLSLACRARITVENDDVVSILVCLKASGPLLCISAPSITHIQGGLNGQRGSYP